MRCTFQGCSANTTKVAKNATLLELHEQWSFVGKQV